MFNPFTLSTNAYNRCINSVVILQRFIHCLPTGLYALHYAFATPKNATHFYPLVHALATPIWILRYR
jgi:hypothetical protein